MKKLTAQQFYEKSRKEGLTHYITENKYPEYYLPFYQAIFRLMEGYAEHLNN